MKEGQFWDIPLSSGDYACGRVLQFDCSNGKKNSRIFLAGLIDWVGDELPTSDGIAGAKLLEQGIAHIKAIGFNGGAIRGFRLLEQDSIEPFLELSHLPLSDCELMKGFQRMRLATLEERKSLYIQSSWGLSVINRIAEIYFVDKKLPIRRLPWEEMSEIIENQPWSG